MARVNCTMRTGPISLAANVTKTLVQLLSATNIPIALLRAKVSFEGVTATDKPVLLQLLLQTDAGTGGLSTITPNVKSAPGASPTIQTGALYGLWATTEPSAGAILDEVYVHPQSGYEWVWQRGQDEVMVAKATRIAVRAVTPTGNQTTNAICQVEWEE